MTIKSHVLDGDAVEFLDDDGSTVTIHLCPDRSGESPVNRASTAVRRLADGLGNPGRLRKSPETAEVYRSWVYRD